MLNLSDHPHRRYNPLTRSWVLCSPHRAKRPWQGQVEKRNDEVRPAYDPHCYLCPGNERAAGQRNPDYKDTFVFRNDFSALLPDSQNGQIDREGLIVAEGNRGVCRVVCFSPRHDLTLAQMETPAIQKIVAAWRDQFEDLSRTEDIRYVQIFENKGPMMGCSNPHPHGQIWAGARIPEEPLKEIYSMEDWHASKGNCLLCDYLKLETHEQTRIVCENNSFVALVPFWAVWPFELMVLAKSHYGGLHQLSSDETWDLADLLRRVTCRYDNLFETSFPYSMGLHQSPVANWKKDQSVHLHLHFYPPLLRSATVKKFMVGYELLAEPQRDITAEQSAERLRGLGETHYRAAASP